jgi:hypothetical protein
MARWCCMVLRLRMRRGREGGEEVVQAVTQNLRTDHSCPSSKLVEVVTFLACVLDMPS